MEETIFTYNEKYSHPYQLALNLTNDCNLACRYCFVEQKPEYMTLDIAIKAVEYLINNLKLHKEIYKDISQNTLGNIWFFGGEPLLCFYSIIQPLVEYCEKKDYLKDINITITTNGTLLDKEKVDFLNKYNIYPMLSIDGAPETQDYNRPCKNHNIKSSQLLENNIPYILKVFPMVLFRSTIYKPTITKMFENYLYAESLGFTGINFTPDTRQIDWTENDYKLMEDQLSEIFAYRLHQYHNNYFPMHYTDVIQTYKKILNHDINIIQNIEINPTYIHNCGLGTYSAAIDYKGQIYNCQERPSKKDNKDFFILGDIFNGINYNYHEKYLTEYINEINYFHFESHQKELCNTCILKPWCLKNCVSLSQDLYHNFHTINEDWCIYYQMIMKFCLNTMDILVKEKNKTFYLDLVRNDEIFTVFKDCL